MGNGNYSIISKCNGLYVDVTNASAKNFANIQMCDGNGLNAQKFKFEKVQTTSTENNNSKTETIPTVKGTKTIEDGVYAIRSAINTRYVLDVNGASKENGANVQLYEYSADNQKRFKVTYLGDGYYTIIALHSNKSLDVKDASKQKGANVWQYEQNGTDAQKWVIKDVGNGNYSIISKCNGLYVDATNASARNFTNIQMCDGNGLNAQKFKFEKSSIDIDTNKYPGYKQRIEALMVQHPTWNIELLYTGLKFQDVIDGEYSVHSRNLVPGDYSGEWICPVCGNKLYDSGWHCTSKKAISYYMDPRNFLNETDVFQFQNVNNYGGATLTGIQSKVSNTYLKNYANDINIACKNKNVNPYYIITRLIQEQGQSGTSIGKGMNGNDGRTYYNPFNIGATGNGWNEIYANALSTAKNYGWDSMEKAIEGGITFCKKNWLENYQNTLYQNKFDIDTRNGTKLYNHQYMQNLLGAYSEARLLREMYRSTNMLDSNFTFIIPVYEEMSITISPLPQNGQISTVDLTNTAVVKTSDGSGCNVRTEPTINSNRVTAVADGTIVKILENGKYNNIDGYNWCKVQLLNGYQGYMPTKFLLIN